MRSLKELRHNI